MKALNTAIILILLSIFVYAGYSYATFPMPRSHANSIYTTCVDNGTIIMVEDSTVMLVREYNYNELDGLSDALETILENSDLELKIIVDGDTVDYKDYNKTFLN